MFGRYHGKHQFFSQLLMRTSEGFVDSNSDLIPKFACTSRVIKKDLGEYPEDLFLNFEKKPIASGRRRAVHFVNPIPSIESHYCRSLSGPGAHRLQQGR